MKKLPALLTTAFILIMFMNACNKENDNAPQQTAEEILTSSPWRIEEIRFLQNNTFYYYKRGVTGDVAGMNTESITFKSDKSGSYTAGTNTYALTWDFIDASKTQLRYIVNYPSPVTIYWENLKIKDGLLDYTEYYSRNGTNSLASARRIH